MNRYSFSARTNRLATLAMVVAAALIVGGCSDDDDGSNGGGGTSGAVYPSVPTARPTLTGMPDALNSSGGSPSGANNGGSAAGIVVRAFDGRVMLDDGRGRPGADNNFLTAAVLGGGSVTWTELTTLAPSQTVTTGAIVTIVLNGQDFFLPTGTVLDLSAAPGGIDTLVIEAQGAGDVIRLDGTVNGVRVTNHSLDLSLVSINATGTAISVDGAVDLSGYDSPVVYNGGAYAATAYSGGIIQRGVVDTAGNVASAANGGAGGGISLLSFFGDVILPPGVLRADGGNAVAGSSGGNGASVFVYCASPELRRFDWGISTRGGLGTTAGGSGGSITVEFDGPLDAFVPFIANSGTATAGSTATAGNVSFFGLTVQGVITGSSNTGQAGQSGNAGDIAVRGESLFGLAVEVQADGGRSTSGTGGTGGDVLVYTDGLACVNLLVDISNRGGRGSTNGGAGGAATFQSYGESRNIDWTSVSTGGLGDTGNGGGGPGSGGISMSSGFGEALTASTFDFTSNGGDGATGGGNGGLVSVILNASDRNDFSLRVNLSGGNGTSANGGNAGALGFNSFGASVASVALDATLNGGQSVSGNGGTGGTITSGGVASRQLTLRGGPINLRGGTCTGTGSGGTGGTFTFSAVGQSTLAVTNVAMDLSGGSTSGAGLNGGSARSGAPDAISVTADRIEWTGGSITANGGTAGSGNGGQSGSVVLDSLGGGTLFTAAVTLNGGNATDNLSSGGLGGTVRFNTASSWVVVNAAITANGGAGGTAGRGGIIMFSGVSTTSFDLNGAWTLNGGAGAGSRAPTGGLGGSVVAGSGTELSAVVRATAAWTCNGAAPGGGAGSIDVDVAGLAGANLTVETGAAFTTNNGAGTPVPANIDLNVNN